MGRVGDVEVDDAPAELPTHDTKKQKKRRVKPKSRGRSRSKTKRFKATPNPRQQKFADLPRRAPSPHRRRRRKSRSKTPEFNRCPSPFEVSEKKQAFFTVGTNQSDYGTVAAAGGDRVNKKLFDISQYGVLDSGATFHCFMRHVKLQDLRHKTVMMTLADGAVTPLTLAGDFHLRCRDENGGKIEPLVLRDVSVVKGSPFNLLSLSLFNNEGLSFFSRRREGPLICIPKVSSTLSLRKSVCTSSGSTKY